MIFQKPDREIGNRMIVEVAGEIGDTNAIVRIDLAVPNRRIARLILYVTARALEPARPVATATPED